VRKLLSELTQELELKDPAFSVVFFYDAEMHPNKMKYSGYNKTTDVLSFGGDDGYLGDILISTETAYNQARKSRTLKFDVNISRLLLHGLLHLLGHDHETDQGEMRAIERRLRRKFRC
jgi:probable rRNA maturation factor